MRLINGAMQHIEKPNKPIGDIHGPLLRALQDLVVGLSLTLDLGRKTIESLWAAIGASQQQISNGPGDTTIAVIEWVQCDEPQVAKSSLDQRLGVRWTIQPVEKALGFGLKNIGGWCLKMHTLTTNRAGYHLHWSIGVISPPSHLDLRKTGVASRKQRGMPAK